MPSKKVRVRVEFPAGMRKLNNKEASKMQSLFRTELANILGADAADKFDSMDFENVTKGPGGGNVAAKKAGSKKGAKKGAKKSSKNG
jgi:hypothetical protein